MIDSLPGHVSRKHCPTYILRKKIFQSSFSDNIKKSLINEAVPDRIFHEESIRLLFSNDFINFWSMKFFEKFGRDIQLEIPQNRPMKDESKKKEEKKLQNKKS